MFADMVKLADTQDLGSCEETRVGSSPTIRIFLYLSHEVLLWEIQTQNLFTNG